MNLMRLEIFVAVCDSGSFTQAADRLGVTKSAASQQVSALERELGVQLLQRSTRRLALTETGRALLDDARALLLQAEALAERARGSAAELSGLLRLTSAEDMAPFVAPLIAEYLQAHPQMRVEYQPTDRLLDLVDAGIDLSIRTTLRRDSSLKSVALAEYAIWCAASPAYLAARGEPRRLADLARHAWIAFAPLKSPWTLRTADSRQSQRLTGALSTHSTAAGRELAIAGCGIFGAPSLALEAEIAAGRLVRVLPRLKLPAVSLYAVWPGRQEPAARTRAFIELAKQRLRS